MSEKWVSVYHDMPPMIRLYCGVTSGYQSEVVRVKTLDGKEYDAGLQLYGNNIRGWNSEWWKNGMLSDRAKIENVICWQSIEPQEGDYFPQTFEEAIKTYEDEEEREKERKKKNPTQQEVG